MKNEKWITLFFHYSFLGAKTSPAGVWRTSEPLGISSLSWIDMDFTPKSALSLSMFLFLWPLTFETSLGWQKKMDSDSIR